MARSIPAVRARRRPTRKGVVLSTELIVDTALRLIDAPGGDKLSVRRLGTELGADPSAIYRHLGGLEESAFPGARDNLIAVLEARAAR